ncbi:MAG TPA: hybrid sensor histidine kinase/response regulator [Oligoflexia bacterium]|nr:hybrid sensor histidine kinase/response regulator [Oligoflexia bacterium]HMP48284.1 hybrid sensor histidine kinase/response regulator [Oligoflexia bacterium]
MRELLAHIDSDYHLIVYVGVLISCILLLLVLLIYRSRSVLEADIELMGHGIRSLMRTGRAPQRLGIRSASLEGLWRKCLAFYAGMSRGGESKLDILEVLGTSIGIAEAGDSEENVLKALSEVVLRSSYPEVRFVAVAVRPGRGHWRVASASGMSRERLEDPLLLAADALPLEERDLLYTRPQDGLPFDFRAMGVGMSLFVPMRFDGEIFGLVWLGFSEAAGAMPEARRLTIEMIVRHAIASYHTARKSTARIEVGLEQKEKMLSLSHDMKAPGMRALYALRELRMGCRSFDDSSMILLKEVEFSIEEQLSLIQSLFSVDNSKGDVGSDVAIPEMEIASVVKQRVESFKVVSRAVNIRLELGELERAKVKIPREALHRILDNLISNAIKYTADGLIRVSVLNVDNSVMVSVSDTGSGVPIRLQPFLFTNAMREKEREVNSGQGYGLTVVRRLTEEYGGSVSYAPDSKTGGSVFSFKLPISTFMEGSLNKPRSRNIVLLIDDDTVVRSSHEKWLSGMFDRVISCGSFEEASVIASLEQPSLVITDVSIPGESLTDFLDGLNFETRVVILSGRPRKSVEDQYGLYPQVFTVMEKPVGKPELRELVRRLEFEDSKKILERAA